MVGYSLSLTQVLNQWAAEGVFSYLFPFLIIFAVVFAILQKTKLFGDSAAQKNVNGINAIIAISVAFISLLNDYVPTFFASIFPKFGIALSIFLVVLIALGFTKGEEEAAKIGWFGWIIAAVVVIWAWSEWGDMFGNSWGLTYFLEEYFWGLVLLVGIGGLIYWIVKSDSGSSSTPKVK